MNWHEGRIERIGTEGNGGNEEETPIPGPKNGKWQMANAQEDWSAGVGEKAETKVATKVDWRGTRSAGLVE